MRRVAYRPEHGTGQKRIPAIRPPAGPGTGGSSTQAHASVAHQMRDLPARESERLARLTAPDGRRKCGCLGALEIGLRTLQNRIAAPRTEAKTTTSGA